MSLGSVNFSFTTGFFSDTNAAKDKEVLFKAAAEATRLPQSMAFGLPGTSSSTIAVKADAPASPPSPEPGPPPAPQPTSPAPKPDPKPDPQLDPKPALPGSKPDPKPTSPDSIPMPKPKEEEKKPKPPENPKPPEKPPENPKPPSQPPGGGQPRTNSNPGIGGQGCGNCATKKMGPLRNFLSGLAKLLLAPILFPFKLLSRARRC